ncbi:hypothetical protein [Pontibacter pamirensis]|nr:hypothetical protein [Pontibacter pamirensis]
MTSPLTSTESDGGAPVEEAPQRGTAAPAVEEKEKQRKGLPEGRTAKGH